MEQGRLAGARAPGDALRLPGFEDEIEIVKDRAGLVGEAHRKPLNFERAIIS